MYFSDVRSPLNKHLVKQYPMVSLDQQQCHVAKEPTLISTILGSCVGITMFDPAVKRGGAAHAFLPYPERGESPQERPCKYVDGAIEHLLALLLQAGAHRSRVEAKLFGGAELLGKHSVLQHPERLQVGTRNIEHARMVLAECGIPLVAQDVGGSAGRKLLFLSHTGEAWVKRF